MNDLIEKELTQLPTAFAIETKDDLAKATTCIKGIKGLKEKVNEAYDSVIEKAHKIHKELIAKRDSYLKPLQKVENEFKANIVTYTKRIEAEQRELERKTNEALAKMAEEQKQKLLDESKSTENEWDAEVLKEKASEIVPTTVETVKKVVEQEGLSIRKTWKARIVNLSLIPKEYWLVNESLLNQHAKDENIRKAGISGIEFYQQETASIKC